MNDRLMTEIHSTRAATIYLIGRTHPTFVTLMLYWGSDFRSLIMLLLIIISTLKAAEITQAIECVLHNQASSSDHRTNGKARKVTCL